MNRRLEAFGQPSRPLEAVAGGRGFKNPTPTAGRRRRRDGDGAGDASLETPPPLSLSHTPVQSSFFSIYTAQGLGGVAYRSSE